MYKIFADDTLIYDSTLEDYHVGTGVVTKEVNKSGSFTFSVYPDHFFYDSFVAMKTVITVYKSGRIVFRGRVLSDVTDYWNNKVLTCEGELGFLQDTVARPFTFQGTPADLFRQLIEKHNEQVGEAKRFKVGRVTVADANDYVNRSSTDYSSTLSMLAGSLSESDLGGYIHITHGDDGTDLIPTIHYLADFETVSSQDIAFGSNLKDYTKTTHAADIATAIIPLGTETGSDGQRLTIEGVNGGVDYIYSPEGVALRDWIFKTVVWEDVTLANNLKAKAEAYLDQVVKQNITIELNAIDLHLLDRSIESFNVCEYVRVTSAPHQFDAVLLCNKQTMDLLKPENDTVVLGYKTASLTGASTQMAASVSTLGKSVSSIKQDAYRIETSVEDLDKELRATIEQTAAGIRSEVADDVQELESQIEQAVDSIALKVTNGAKSSAIALTVDGVEVSSQTVEFTGDVVFANDLQDGQTVISGNNIKTGLISADRIKLGGEMTLYQALDSNDSAGTLGYTTVRVGTQGSSTYFSGKALGINASAHATVMAPGGNLAMASYGDVYIGSQMGVVNTLGNALRFNGVNVAYVSSDRRLKKNIDYSASDKLVAIFDGLKPATFELNDDSTEGQEHVGFIAQDVVEAARAAGLTNALVATDCNGMYALNYGELTAVLTAKVQQLEAKIKDLTEQVDLLKGTAGNEGVT